MTALRSLWNASLRLNELRLPVALAATRGSSDVALRTLHRPCAHPLAQRLECPVHGEVPAEELVSGWEVSPGEFVLVEPDELEDLGARDGDERTIEVLQAFPSVGLDPVLAQAAYWLMPSGGEIGRRGYRLLSSALGARTSLLARLNYRGEKVAAIRATANGSLLLQTLAAAADRYLSTPIADELASVTCSRSERRLMRELLAARTAPLEEQAIVNPRRQQLRRLLEQKLAAGDATVRSTVGAAPRGHVDLAPADLEEALRRSLESLRTPEGAAA